MHKAVFLDRDGVINRKPPEGSYITCWEDMQLFPDVCEALRRLTCAGFYIIVVTNQRCVSKGLISVAQLDDVHCRMRDTLAQSGGIIDAIYYCPHDTSENCNCRKPKPGMLLDAARLWRLDLTASWMIGDSVSDIKAGSAAGCRTVRIVPESAAVHWMCEGYSSNRQTPDLVATSLCEASAQILNWRYGLSAEPASMDLLSRGSEDKADDCS